MLQEITTNAVCTKKQAYTPICDGFVKLNVGGVVFLTTLATLKAEESRLSADADSGFCRLPRDDAGLPFYDRDPFLFRFVLNYLRGYPLLMSSEEASALVQDAIYYELPGLMLELGMAPALEGHSFFQGPGVSPDGKLLTSAVKCSYLGRGPLIPGVQSCINFKLRRLIDDSACSASFGVAEPGQPLLGKLSDRKNAIAYSTKGTVFGFVMKQPHSDSTPVGSGLSPLDPYYLPSTSGSSIPDVIHLKKDRLNKKQLKAAKDGDCIGLKAHLSNDSKRIVVEFSVNGEVVACVDANARELLWNNPMHNDKPANSAVLPLLQPIVCIQADTIVEIIPEPGSN